MAIIQCSPLFFVNLNNVLVLFTALSHSSVIALISTEFFHLRKELGKEEREDGEVESN